MKVSYLVGLTVVVSTVLASAVPVVLLGKYGTHVPSRAGWDLGEAAYDLGPFRLTERSGRAVTEADLADDVWVAAFIFTRCPSSCPRISAVMKGLQGPLGDSGVKLVSFSVDPEYDTPAVLSRYADGFGADPARWWFLTGPEAEIYRLILERFHISVSRQDRVITDPSVEAVAHSNRLVLVDRGGKVSGVYESDDPAAVRSLVSKARRMTSWARRLPAVNAGLNGTCAVLLLIGWVFILSGRVRAHATCMISAVVVSAVFLGSYLAYHYEVGSVSFRGEGAIKGVYLTILLSHTLLATFGVVPLVGLTLYRASRRQFRQHAAIARVTFPIWLYVSITGVVIYWMLYQMPINRA